MFLVDCVKGLKMIKHCQNNAGVVIHNVLPTLKMPIVEEKKEEEEKEDHNDDAANASVNKEQDLSQKKD